MTPLATLRQARCPSPLVTASDHCCCFAHTLFACCPLLPLSVLGTHCCARRSVARRPIVRSAMRGTHGVKSFRMVEYNDDAARYLSLLSNNSIIEQQFNEIAPPARTTHAQRNVATSLSSRIERMRIEINGSDRMGRNHKPPIMIMKQ